MKNPFKEILNDEKLPEIIRSRVLNDVDLIRLSLDLSDLFLVKSPNILRTLFKKDDDKK